MIPRMALVLKQLRHDTDDGKVMSVIVTSMNQTLIISLDEALC
jgi:hypothetical protein